MKEKKVFLCLGILTIVCLGFLCVKSIKKNIQYNGIEMQGSKIQFRAPEKKEEKNQDTQSMENDQIIGIGLINVLGILGCFRWYRIQLERELTKERENVCTNPEWFCIDK